MTSEGAGKVDPVAERQDLAAAVEEFRRALAVSVSPARGFVLRHWLALTLATWAALLVLALVVQLTEGRGAEILLIGCVAWFAPRVWRRFR